MPPMASVGTGQYLVDGTRRAVVVPSKRPTWLYGAIDPERTLRHMVSPQRKQLEHLRYLNNLLRFLWCQIIFRPFFFMKDIHKNPQDEPGRSHLKSLTSSWKTHHNKSVSITYPLKLANLHTTHNKDPLHGVHSLLSSRQELNTKHQKVSCDLCILSVYLWLQLKLRWSKGSVVWNNVNRGIGYNF